jgi:general nucleoside transport system permease protein
MAVMLQKRSDRSRTMALASPLIALALTVIVGGLIFWARGIDPLHGLSVYFIEPLTADWSREQLIVKATPLILIGAGLAICYSANVWNIGAEGQFVMGALFAGAVPVFARHAALGRHRRHGLGLDSSGAAYPLQRQ